MTSRLWRTQHALWNTQNMPHLVTGYMISRIMKYGFLWRHFPHLSHSQVVKICVAFMDISWYTAFFRMMLHFHHTHYQVVNIYTAYADIVEYCFLWYYFSFPIITWYPSCNTAYIESQNILRLFLVLGVW